MNRVISERWPWAKALSLQQSGVVYALALLIAALQTYSVVTSRPSYLSADNVVNVLDQASLVAIMAIFMTVVLITGNFDLSVGATAALAGAVALKAVDTVGAPVAILIAVTLGAAIGVLNGVLVQYLGVNAFIVTLGTLTAGRGAVLLLTDGRTVSATDQSFIDLQSGERQIPVVVAIIVGLGFAAIAAALAVRGRAAANRTITGTVLALGLGSAALLATAVAAPRLLRLPIPVWLMILAALGAGSVLQLTVVGRRLYASGGNPEAARLSGISISRYRVVAFVLNGAAAGFVGVLYAGKLGAINPQALQGIELTVLAAAILGGTSLLGGSGSVFKSVVGALILFVLANGFNILNLGANWQGLVQGVVIVAAATVYTTAGRRARRTKKVREAAGNQTETEAPHVASKSKTPA